MDLLQTVNKKKQEKESKKSRVNEVCGKETKSQIDLERGIVDRISKDIYLLVLYNQKYIFEKRIEFHSISYWFE